MDAIREARLAAGYPSQAALARSMGVGRAAVHAWESGRSMPRGKQLRALAEAGVDISDAVTDWWLDGSVEGVRYLARVLFVDSQTALARAAGVSQTTVSFWERGGWPEGAEAIEVALARLAGELEDGLAEAMELARDTRIDEAEGIMCAICNEKLTSSK